MRHGETILLAGGLDSADKATDLTYRIDLSGERLAPGPKLVEASHDGGAGDSPDGVIVFGGGATTSSPMVQRVGVDRTTKLPPLPTALSDQATTTCGGRIFMFGGFDKTNALSTIFEAHTDGTVETVGRLPDPVRYGSAACVNGVAYIFGGERGQTKATTDILAFSPDDKSVRSVGSLPVPLAHAASLTLGGAIYLCGGRDRNGRAVSAVYRFESATSQMVDAGQLPAPLADAATAEVDESHALLLGGWNATPTDTIVAASIS